MGTQAKILKVWEDGEAWTQRIHCTKPGIPTCPPISCDLRQIILHLFNNHTEVFDYLQVKVFLTDYAFYQK